MKKTILTLICGLTMSLSAVAQTQDLSPFAKDKFFCGASLSGFDAKWTNNTKWNLDIGAKIGYLFDTNWMVTANAEYDVRHYGNNVLFAGAGLRYYFEDYGIFLGASGNYVHGTQGDRFDDFMPSVQVGYAFFLNRTVTIEPEVYYNQSLQSHSDYSGFGLRIGIGIYFENLGL